MQSILRETLRCVGRLVRTHTKNDGSNSGTALTILNESAAPSAQFTSRANSASKIQEDCNRRSIREKLRLTVTIGKVDLSNYVKDVQIKRVVEPHTERREAMIVLDLSGLREFYHANLRDQLVVEDEARRHREFSGVVVESYLIDSQMYALSCRSGEQYLKELVVSHAAFENFTLQEIVYHLVKQTSDIDASERSIQGLSLNRQERDFLVAVPVHGLVVRNPIAVSFVTFFKLEQNSHDTKVMLEKGGWKEGTAIASITVKSTGFLEAWTIGRATISNVVDALSYGGTLSTIGYPTAIGGYKTFEWERASTFSELSLGEQTYLRDMSTEPPKTWLRSEPTRESDLALVDRHSLVNISDALLKTSNSLKSLAFALRWLRLGTQESDLTDRLLDYWIALEFLVANERVSTSLSRNGLEDLESAITNARIRNADGSNMTPEKKQALSVRTLSRINQVDLRERFDVFLLNRKHAITATGDEYERIWGKGGLRDQRNALEHGRSVHVDEEALKTMKHVLDKMILAILSGDIQKC